MFPLAALLALGCARRPLPQAIHPVADLAYHLPGDERVPILSPADVVGRYRSVYDGEVIDIYVDSGELMMQSNHDSGPRRVALGDDGGLGIYASLRAGLVRRRGRMMLHIDWCYRWGIYWLVDREPTPPNS